ncbi:MAG: hypothetical protein ACKOC5_15420, partial [Chloroflexota bacterium]
QQAQLRSGPLAQVVCSGGDSYACSYYAGRFGFQPVSPAEAAQAGQDVWWMQTFIGREQGPADALGQARQALGAGQVGQPGETLLTQAQVFQYGEQDPGVRALKQRLAGLEDYQYRLVVYWFQRSGR